jgi:hypothetical protein
MSKARKSIIIVCALILVVALTGIFAACNPGQAGPQTTNIEGTYVFEHEETEEDDYFKSEVQIKADNQIVCKRYDQKDQEEPAFESTGTYTVDEASGTLIVQLDEESDFDEYRIVIYNNNLYIGYGLFVCEKVGNYYYFEEENANIEFKDGKFIMTALDEEGEDDDSEAYDYRLDGEILYLTYIDEAAEEPVELLSGLLRGGKLYLMITNGEVHAKV